MAHSDHTGPGSRINTQHYDTSYGKKSSRPVAPRSMILTSYTALWLDDVQFAMDVLVAL